MIKHNIWRKLIAIGIMCLFLANTTFQGISYAGPANYSLATGNIGKGQGVTEQDLEPFKGIVGDGEEIVYYGVHNPASTGIFLIDADGRILKRSNGKGVFVPSGKTVHLGVVWSSMRETHYTDVRIGLADILGYELDPDTGALLCTKAGEEVTEAQRRNFEIAFGAYAIMHEWGHEAQNRLLNDLDRERKYAAWAAVKNINSEVFATVFAKAGLGLLDKQDSGEEWAALFSLGYFCGENADNEMFAGNFIELFKGLFGLLNNEAILRYDGSGEADLMAALERAGFEFTVPHMRDLTFSDPDFPDTYEPDVGIRRELQLALARAVADGRLEAMAAPGGDTQGSPSVVQTLLVQSGLTDYITHGEDMAVAVGELLHVHRHPDDKRLASDTKRSLCDLAKFSLVGHQGKLDQELLEAIEVKVDTAVDTVVSLGRLVRGMPEEGPKKEIAMGVKKKPARKKPAKKKPAEKKPPREKKPPGAGGGIGGQSTVNPESVMQMLSEVIRMQDDPIDLIRAGIDMEGIIPTVVRAIRHPTNQHVATLALTRLHQTGCVYNTPEAAAVIRLLVQLGMDPISADKCVKDTTQLSGRGTAMSSSGAQVAGHRGTGSLHDDIMKALRENLKILEIEGRVHWLRAKAFRDWYDGTGPYETKKRRPGEDVPEELRLPIKQLSGEEFMETYDGRKLYVVALPVDDFGKTPEGDPITAHVGLRWGKGEGDGIIWVAVGKKGAVRSETDVQLDKIHEREEEYVVSDAELVVKTLDDVRAHLAAIRGVPKEKIEIPSAEEIGLIVGGKVDRNRMAEWRDAASPVAQMFFHIAHKKAWDRLSLKYAARAVAFGKTIAKYTGETAATLTEQKSRLEQISAETASLRDESEIPEPVGVLFGRGIAMTAKRKAGQIGIGKLRTLHNELIELQSELEMAQRGARISARVEALNKNYKNWQARLQEILEAEELKTVEASMPDPTAGGLGMLLNPARGLQSIESTTSTMDAYFEAMQRIILLALGELASSLVESLSKTKAKDAEDLAKKLRTKLKPLGLDVSITHKSGTRQIEWVRKFKPGTVTESTNRTAISTFGDQEDLRKDLAYMIGPATPRVVSSSELARIAKSERPQKPIPARTGLPSIPPTLAEQVQGEAIEVTFGELGTTQITTLSPQAIFEEPKGDTAQTDKGALIGVHRVKRGANDQIRGKFAAHIWRFVHYGFVTPPQGLEDDEFRDKIENGELRAVFNRDTFRKKRKTIKAKNGETLLIIEIPEDHLAEVYDEAGNRILLDGHVGLREGVVWIATGKGADDVQLNRLHEVEEYNVTSDVEFVRVHVSDPEGLGLIKDGKVDMARMADWRDGKFGDFTEAKIFFDHVHKEAWGEVEVAIGTALAKAHYDFERLAIAGGNIEILSKRIDRMEDIAERAGKLYQGAKIATKVEIPEGTAKDITMSTSEEAEQGDSAQASSQETPSGKPTAEEAGRVAWLAHLLSDTPLATDIRTTLGEVRVPKVAAVLIDACINPDDSVEHSVIVSELVNRFDVEESMAEAWVDRACTVAKSVNKAQGMRVQPDLPYGKKLMALRVEALGRFSERTRKAFDELGIRTVENLVNNTAEELLEARQFGQTHLNEVREILAGHGLSLLLDIEIDMNAPATSLGRFSPRARNAFVQLGISTVGDLVNRTPEDLLEASNFGQTSLNEVREILARQALFLRRDTEIDRNARVITIGRFSARVRTVFRHLGIVTAGDLLSKTEAELREARNFGPTCLYEVKGILAKRNLALRADDPPGGIAQGNVASILGWHRGEDRVNDQILDRLDAYAKVLVQEGVFTEHDIAQFVYWYKQHPHKDVPMKYRLPLEKLDPEGRGTLPTTDGRGLYVRRLPFDELAEVDNKIVTGHLGPRDGNVWVAVGREGSVRQVDDKGIELDILHEWAEYELESSPDKVREIWSQAASVLKEFEEEYKDPKLSVWDYDRSQMKRIIKTLPDGKEVIDMTEMVNWRINATPLAQVFFDLLHRMAWKNVEEICWEISIGKAPEGIVGKLMLQLHPEGLDQARYAAMKPGADGFLKVARVNKPETAVIFRTGDIAQASSKKQQKTILLVQDNLELRRAQRDYFRSEGYRVLEASSAEEGIALLQSKSPTRILTDLGLEEESSGERMVEAAHAKNIPAIVYTGQHLAPLSISRLESLGANRVFMQHMTSWDEVASAVEKLGTPKRKKRGPADGTGTAMANAGAQVGRHRKDIATGTGYDSVHYHVAKGLRECSEYLEKIGIAHEAIAKFNAWFDSQAETGEHNYEVPDDVRLDMETLHDVEEKADNGEMLKVVCLPVRDFGRTRYGTKSPIRAHVGVREGVVWLAGIASRNHFKPGEDFNLEKALEHPRIRTAYYHEIEEYNVVTNVKFVEKFLESLDGKIAKQLRGRLIVDGRVDLAALADWRDENSVEAQMFSHMAHRATWDRVVERCDFELSKLGELYTPNRKRSAEASIIAEVRSKALLFAHEAIHQPVSPEDFAKLGDVSEELLREAGTAITATDEPAKIKRRILVADECPIDRGLISDALRDLMGAGTVDVVGVASVEQALAQVRENPYDLVICSYALAEENGARVAKEMEGIEINQDTPVVMMAGKQVYGRSAEEIRREEGLSNLVTSIPKPLHLDANTTAEIVQVSYAAIIGDTTKKVNAEHMAMMEEPSKVSEPGKIIIPVQLIPGEHAKDLRSSVRANDIEILSIGEAIGRAKDKNATILLTLAQAQRYSTQLRSPECKAKIIILDGYDFLYLDGAIGLARAIYREDDARMTSLWKMLTGEEQDAQYIKQSPLLEVPLYRINIDQASEEYRQLQQEALVYLRNA